MRDDADLPAAEASPPAVGPASPRLAAVAAMMELLSAGDPDLERLSRVAASVAHAPVALVSLVDEQAQHFPAQTGMPQPWQHGTPISHSMCRYVVDGGAPLLVPDTSQDPRFERSPARRDLDIQAYAGFPLRDADGEVLGSFCVLDREPRQWAPGELSALADLAAVVQGHLQRRMALQRQTARIQLLVEVTEALHAQLDVDIALKGVGDRLVPGYADICVVDVVGGEARLETSLVSAAQPRLERLLRAAERRLARRDNPRSVLASGLRGEAALQVIDDAWVEFVAAGDADLAAGYRALGMHTALVAPLRGRNGVSGVLTLARVAGSPPFEEADLALVEELGLRIGVALDNARLYEHEYRTALALQRSLLPAPVSSPGLQLAARYAPSRLAGRVGGDWYDLLELPGGRVGLVMGDVAGHDVAAAAAMGQLRAIVRAHAWEGAEPRDVVDRTCRVLRGLDSERVATLLYAVLGPPLPDGSRRLRYTSAGHPPALLATAEGVVRLDRSSPLLGVDSDGRREAEAVLPAGGLLVSYTDGLVERRTTVIDDGIDRVARTLVAARLDPVERIADRLLEELEAAGGSDDDVALLVLRNAG